MVNSCPKVQSIKHIVLQTPHPILHTPYSTVLHTTYHSAFLLNAGSSTGLTWSVHGRPGELDGSFLILFPHPLLLFFLSSSSSLLHPPALLLHLLHVDLFLRRFRLTLCSRLHSLCSVLCFITWKPGTVGDPRTGSER